jgi:DNA-directed RNA polymerase subunit K/omega
MVSRPSSLNKFEFTVLAALRAAQLQRGCAPRVSPSGKIAVTAQQEVAAGKVVQERPLAGPTEETVE